MSSVCAWLGLMSCVYLNCSTVCRITLGPTHRAFDDPAFDIAEDGTGDMEVDTEEAQDGYRQLQARALHDTAPTVFGESLSILAKGKALGSLAQQDTRVFIVPTDPGEPRTFRVGKLQLNDEQLLRLGPGLISDVEAALAGVLGLTRAADLPPINLQRWTNDSSDRAAGRNISNLPSNVAVLGALPELGLERLDATLSGNDAELVAGKLAEEIALLEMKFLVASTYAGLSSAVLVLLTVMRLFPKYIYCVVRPAASRRPFCTCTRKSRLDLGPWTSTMGCLGSGLSRRSTSRRGHLRSKSYASGPPDCWNYGSCTSHWSFRCESSSISS